MVLVRNFARNAHPKVLEKVDRKLVCGVFSEVYEKIVMKDFFKKTYSEVYINGCIQEQNLKNGI